MIRVVMHYKNQPSGMSRECAASVHLAMRRDQLTGETGRADLRECKHRARGRAEVTRSPGDMSGRTRDLLEA